MVVILVLYLVDKLPIDGNAEQIVRVIVIIIGIISLLKYLSFEAWQLRVVVVIFDPQTRQPKTRETRQSAS